MTMTSLRQVILILLLLTVPFQAAVGATGIICTNWGHHSQGSIAALDHADVGTPAHDHDGVDASGPHGSPASNNAAGSHDSSGKCSICSTCCPSSAAIPASAPDVVRPDGALKVSASVDQALLSRPGDSLFRPPRTTTL
jgi:hypothetical protein